MPRVISEPRRKKRKGVGGHVKCRGCGCKVQFYEGDAIWTDYGNTEGRCPRCGYAIFIGRLGRKDDC